ncbi:Vegetative incompatibility protein HET-E-1 [Ceratocystis lukuohia]|uniref:Vegetative incompatibility protein HET-E-1 n=1 Tax=Ceratocystis lukuohia TaxID=2019550 RepID=A0ABR4M8M5_9PEZI
MVEIPKSGKDGPVMVLSFDGGGVRSLSSLLIIERIMETIQTELEASELPKPCQVFDFIGGSGTGGIIAILLGRLAMSAAEAIIEYKSIIRKAFTQSPQQDRSLQGHESSVKLSVPRLEEAIKDTISKYESKRVREILPAHDPANESLHGNALYCNKSCVKTMVLARTRVNIDTTPTLLKTYHAPGAFAECKIWEVARATSAAVQIFDSIKMGRDNIEFIDASFGSNNPSGHVIKEVKSVFKDYKMVIASIGTGLGDTIKLEDTEGNSVAKSLTMMAESSKAEEMRLKKIYHGTGTYHRFNVGSNLRDKTAWDWGIKNDIPDHTSNYLGEDTRSIESYIKVIKDLGFQLGQQNSILVANIEVNYGVLDVDFYNFDETGFMMGMISSAMLVARSERRGKAKTVQPGHLELVTVILGINAERWVIPPFNVVKGSYHLGN